MLSPGKIGTMTLRNRIAVTAMGASLAEPDGQCGERIIRYHEEQAKGGAGLIITGVAGVAWPVGGNQINQIAVSDDKFLPGLINLANAVHGHGAKIAAQLHHGGLVAMEDMLAGRPVWCPSLPGPPKGDFTAAFLLEEIATAPFGRIRDVTFKVMTEKDIKSVTDQFAAAALRVKSAGFDAIEIHGGHGYLLSSFISASSNRRTDSYGGSLENRARFLLETLVAVRKAVGPDFPIWVKLDTREIGKDNGGSIDDAIMIARWCETAGADAITATAYHETSKPKLHTGSHTPHEPGINLPYAKQLRAAIGIPVIASGRIEPDVGDAHIASGAVDFISMGRKLLADPHLPRKLAEGRPEDILPCVYCYTCISAIYVCDTLRCAVNPETAFEYQRSTAQKVGKRVVVIGGGPGGMEAARRLDAIGHDVTLIEQDSDLGGTLRFASLAYPANERLLRWLRRQVDQSSVTIMFNTIATPELLASMKPDEVIVATGAIRGMPEIVGKELPHVLSGDDMRQLMLGESSESLALKIGWITRLITRIGAITGLMANLEFVRRASKFWMPLGKRVVIIGGELVGLELAEFLVMRGRKVEVVDEAPRPGAGLTVARRMRLLEELREHGVGINSSVTDIQIGTNDVSFADSQGNRQARSADHVIIAKGATGNPALADRLVDKGFSVHAIGDCTGVGYIEGAMRGAAKVSDLISR